MQTPDQGGLPIEAIEGEVEFRTFHGAKVMATKMRSRWESYATVNGRTYKLTLGYKTAALAVFAARLVVCDVLGLDPSKAFTQNPELRAYPTDVPGLRVVADLDYAVAWFESGDRSPEYWAGTTVEHAIEMALEAKTPGAGLALGRAPSLTYHGVPVVARRLPKPYRYDLRIGDTHHEGRDPSDRRMLTTVCKVVAGQMLLKADPLPEVRPNNVALYCVETEPGDIFLVMQEEDGGWVTAHGNYRAEGDAQVDSLDLMLRAMHAVSTGDSSLGTFQMEPREGEAPSLLWVTEVAP